VALIGGVKISTKIKLVKELAKRYDAVLLGGGLVNPLLAEQGFEIGASLTEQGVSQAVKPLLKLKKVFLPVDVVVGIPAKPASLARVVPIAIDAPSVVCRKQECIGDVGPATILAWAAKIKKAKTIVWNGPLGIAEIPRFSHGTIALGRLIASRSKGRALGVVGGGETVEALERTGMANWVDHVSTGGGAMLEFLEGKTLPGVKPLYGRAVKH